MRLVDTTIDIAAPPERVFDLFTTVDGLCRWMAVEAAVDLRPGGAWRWVHDNGDACSGRYLVVERPRTLSFTYGWESGRFADVSPGSSRVDVRFEPSGGGTQVTLRHTGLPSDRADPHEHGWNHFLGRLATTGGREHRHARFWDLVDAEIARGLLAEGTLMGHQCVRSAATGGFVATVERSTGDLVVKLPRDRVAELVAAGEGRPFAPARRVFKEWVAIPATDDDGATETHWSSLLDESIDFVGTS